MTSKEWMDIGMNNGVINELDHEEVAFFTVYKSWFLMKTNVIKAQSCDRIEVTFNKYYAGNSILQLPVSKFTEELISDFLNNILIKVGSVTKKEYTRIYQIINNVLVYARDLHIGGAPLIDWTVVNRYIYVNNIEKNDKKEFAISHRNKMKFMKAIIQDNVYDFKRSTALCLCLNFYLGLRVGELASLTWSDIDYEKRVVRIFKTETKAYSRDKDGNRLDLAYRIVEDTKTIYSVREVPLIPEALQIIALIRENQEQKHYHSDYLCYDGVKDAIFVRALDRTMRKVCALIRIPTFNTHKIRKTFASDLHEAGASTKLISDLLGHADISTTEKYYIEGYEDEVEKSRKIMQNSLRLRM